MATKRRAADLVEWAHWAQDAIERAMREIEALPRPRLHLPRSDDARAVRAHNRRARSHALRAARRIREIATELVATLTATPQSGRGPLLVRPESDEPFEVVRERIREIERKALRKLRRK